MCPLCFCVNLPIFVNLRIWHSVQTVVTRFRWGRDKKNWALLWNWNEWRGCCMLQHLLSFDVDWNRISRWLEKYIYIEQIIVIIFTIINISYAMRSSHVGCYECGHVAYSRTRGSYISLFDINDEWFMTLTDAYKRYFCCCCFVAAIALLLLFLFCGRVHIYVMYRERWCALRAWANVCCMAQWP